MTEPMKPEDRNKPILDRVLPDLAATGCLVNEHWVPAGCTTAAQMFDDRPLRIVGVLMVACHRSGFDLLQQAPVLACAFVGRQGKRNTKWQMQDVAQWTVRRTIIRTIAARLEKAQRLRELLKGFGLARQLRVLKGSSLDASDLPLLQRLSEIDPSTLAQAIPTDGFVQQQWMAGLRGWCQTLVRREADPWRHFEWVATHLGPGINDAVIMGGKRRPTRFDIRTDIGTIADFVAAGNGFNPAWSWARAIEEAENWHASLRSLDQAQRFLLEHKVGFEDRIDYGALPDRIEVGDIEVVALRSGAELHSEGSRMRHCVFSYARSVINGNCRIYSVRRGETRLATMELVRDDKKNVWSIVQLKARFNAQPAPDAQFAASEFLAGINAEARR